MNYEYINLKNDMNLIKGVVIKKLTIHKDASGSLVETLREDWDDVYHNDFKMQYMSTTPSSVARDEDTWHVHKFQKDRFICLSGRIVTAVYDPRDNSSTKGKLNLFTIGPENDDEMFMIVIPENTYHGFIVVSAEPGHLINFPTQLYNPQDEGRIDHQNELNWKKVREDFGL